MTPDIREYVEGDSPGWLRCRLLSFFETDYYDDVLVERPQFDGPNVRLVADADGTIVGLIDVAIDGSAATIESIAMLPEHQRGGVGQQLLRAAVEALPGDVRTLDAWTREMPATNAWYQANGFKEQEAAVRGRHRRVYVCRQYLRKL